MFLGWNYSYTAADGTTKSGTVTDYTTVPVMGDIAFHAVILRVPFISTSATNGLVSILNAADNTTTPTADKDAVENIQIADLPAQAALNFVPLNTVDYTLDTTNSMIVRNFAASPVNKTITASGTYAFPSDASALQLTVDFANGTLRSTKNITTDDSLDIHLNYVPKQTTYTVNHYAMAVDGTYPTTPTTTETSGTVDALTNATFTPKKATDTGFVGTAYDSTLTTYQDVDQTTASTTVTNVRGDGSTVVSLYYPRNAYTVTYNANGHGTAPAAQNNVLYGNTTIAPTAPTVVGYTFGGWYTDNTCSDTSAWDFTKNTVTSDSTLYAKWTPITYTVTFDKNAAKATGTMNNQTMTYDVAAQLTKNGFTRPGYTFTGWNTETGVGYTDEQSVKNLAAEDTSVALYAQWHENSAVDINYATSNGGMVNPAGDQYVAPSSGVATGSTATPDAGYHFVKWTNNIDSTTTTDATLTSTQVDAVAKASGAYVATIFTAHFAENNPVKITYVSADAATGTVNPESESVAPATGTVEGSTAIAKPGYHFVNWTNSVNGDFTTDATLSADQIDSAAKVTGAYAPTTFTAHFAENNPVTMAYATANTVMGSVNPTSQTLAPATGMAAGSTATANPGYHFTNWSNNIDGTTTSDSVLSTEQVDAVAKASGAYVPVAFTAHFAEDDPVTITYVSANAKAGTVDPTSQTLAPVTGTAVGSTATAAAGYHFVNWTDASGKEVSAAAKFVPNKINGLNVGATYTANFAENDPITINYASANTTMGSVTPTTELLAPATGTAAGSTATAAAGYHFVNWIDASGKEVSTAVKFVPDKAEGLNVAATFTANFAITNYDVTFVDGDHGTVTGDGLTQSVAYGSHPTADKLVVTPEAGYAFDSWSYTTTKDDGSVVTATTTDPSSVAILGTTVFKPVFKYVGIPDVVMNKTVATPSGDGTAQPGEIVTYKLTITNNGDGTSKGIWVKDLIPDNTTYLTADSDGTSATDAKSGKQYITWYLADGLAAGASKTLTFTALVGTCADGTSVDNVAYYEETATKPDPDDTSVLPKTASNKATFTVSVPATPAASADSTASTSTPTGSTTTATTTNNALAQTGDSFSIAGIVGLMIASLIAAGYVLYRRRRQE